jgi:hypothetical protein
MGLFGFDECCSEGRSGEVVVSPGMANDFVARSAIVGNEGEAFGASGGDVSVVMGHGRGIRRLG